MVISQLHKLFLDSNGVSTDTRSLKKGQIYFALKGDNFDGNKFTQQALDNGALYAITDDYQYQGKRTILVEDSLKALQELAIYHRNKLSIPVIGLTGSNGKTTSKELLVAVLSKKFKTACTQGNLNNHIGVPLTILSITEEDEIAVIEMGANHQKEIAFLSNIAQPDHGFITNFGKAHLEGFGGIEGIIKGKSELYDYLRKHNKTAWVNTNDQKQIAQSQGIKRMYFGSTNQADYKVFNLGSNSNGFLKLKFENEEFSTKLTGDYNFSNAASAIALGQHFGVVKADIIKALKEYTPENNRSQIAKTQNNVLVKDYYNANPSSMELAITNFSSLDFKNKWLILGDMFELGLYEQEEHQTIASLADKFDFEKVILVGEAFFNTKTKGLQFKTTHDIVNWLKLNPPKAKTILIKGSRGMKLELAADLL